MSDADSDATSDVCECCGTPLAPNEGVEVDPVALWNTIEKRLKVDAHMRTCHLDHHWSPLSPDHVQRLKKRGCLQMLLDDPEMQFNTPKVRKTEVY